MPTRRVFLDTNVIEIRRWRLPPRHRPPLDRFDEPLRAAAAVLACSVQPPI